MPSEECPYVSRGGLKLEAALRALGVNPAGMTCADLGCNVGGFTDCLLQHGATRVFAVDSGYGQLAWMLRNDSRVTALERTNALHFDPWTLDGFAGCDLVVIDMGWTRQARAIPAALRWLRGRTPGQARPLNCEPIAPDSPGLALQARDLALRGPHPVRIITLIKPHYEADRELLGGKRGVLDDNDAQAVCERVLSQLPAMGGRVLGSIVSPIRGGAGKGRRGNIEYLAGLGTDR